MIYLCLKRAAHCNEPARTCFDIYIYIYNTIFN